MPKDKEIKKTKKPKITKGLKKKPKTKKVKGVKLTKKQLLELKLKEYALRHLPSMQGGGGGGGIAPIVQNPNNMLPNANNSALLHSSLLQSDKVDAIRDMKQSVEKLKEELAQKQKQEADKNILALFNPNNKKSKKEKVLSKEDFDIIADILHSGNSDLQEGIRGNLKSHGKYLEDRFNNSDDKINSGNRNLENAMFNMTREVKDLKSKPQSTNVTWNNNPLKMAGLDENMGPSYRVQPMIDSRNYQLNYSSRDYQPIANDSYFSRDYKPETEMDRFSSSSSSSSSDETPTQFSSSSSLDAPTEDKYNIGQQTNDILDLADQNISRITNEIADIRNDSTSYQSAVPEVTIENELNNMMSHDESINVDAQGISSNIDPTHEDKITAEQVLSNRDPLSSLQPLSFSDLNSSNARILPATELYAQNIINDRNTSARIIFPNDDRRRKMQETLNEIAEDKRKEDEEKELEVKNIELEQRNKSIAKFEAQNKLFVPPQLLYYKEKDWDKTQTLKNMLDTAKFTDIGDFKIITRAGHFNRNALEKIGALYNVKITKDMNADDKTHAILMKFYNEKYPVKKLNKK